MPTEARTGLVAEWFTPVDQRDAPEDPDKRVTKKNAIVIVDRPTRYKLKPLDGLQFMEIMTHGEHTALGEFVPTHLGRVLTLRYTLKDWENLDHNGKADKFSIAALHHVPGHHLIECANHIIEVSAPGADDAKNSE